MSEERKLNTPEDSVDDLAVGLGMLMAAEGCRPERQPAYDCWIESILVLAFCAGVERQRALRPFDVNRSSAERIWARIEAEIGGESG